MGFGTERWVLERNDYRGVRASLCIEQASDRLATAQQKLDAALAALPEVSLEDTMATPALLALVLNTVAAQRHLQGIQTQTASPKLGAANLPRLA